ncbi:MAG: ABC transporter ATP-binding protein, partial [Chloroflexota bacterium]
NDITRMPPHQICRMGLTRTFQRETTFPGLSAFDNVLVAIEHSKTAAGQRENEMLSEQALDIVGFPKTMHNIPAETLPLFNRKQLMLAGALAFSPRLILLDEPASSLTKPEIEKLKKIIIRINQGGVSILLIEHVLALLIDVSQRLLILNHGKMLSMGEPDKVIKEASVIEAYLGNQGKENATTS